MTVEDRAVSVAFVGKEYGRTTTYRTLPPVTDMEFPNWSIASHDWVLFSHIVRTAARTVLVLRILHPDRKRSVTITTNDSAYRPGWKQHFGPQVEALVEAKRGGGPYPYAIHALFDHFWDYRRPRDVHVAAAEPYLVAAGLGPYERALWLDHPHWGAHARNGDRIRLMHTKEIIAALHEARIGPDEAHEFLLAFQSCRADGERLDVGTIPERGQRDLIDFLSAGWTGEQVFHLTTFTDSEYRPGDLPGGECHPFGYADLSRQWLRMAPNVAVSAARAGLSAPEALRGLHDGSLTPESVHLIGALL